MTVNSLAKKLTPIFQAEPKIKLVYLFGSQATGGTGPLSDYDFAFYIDEKDSLKRFDLRLKIDSEISLALKTDKVDTVVINSTEMPELKFHIIAYGKLIYEVEPYKLLVEPRAMIEYYDFKLSLQRNNLTKVK